MLDEQTPAEPGNEPTTSAPGSASEPLAATDTPSAIDSPPPADAPPPRKRAPRKTAAKKTAAPDPSAESDAAGGGSADLASDGASDGGSDGPAAEPAPRRRTRKTAAKKSTAAAPDQSVDQSAETPADDAAPAKKTPAKRTRKSTAKRTTSTSADSEAPTDTSVGEDDSPSAAQTTAATAPLFQPPDPAAAKPAKKSGKKKSSVKAAAETADEADAAETEADETEAVVATDATDATDAIDADQDDADETAEDTTDDEDTDESGSDDSGSDETEGGARRRRRRGGRRRRKGSGDGGGDSDGNDQNGAGDDQPDDKQSDKQGGKQGGKQGDGPAEKSDSDGDGGSSTRRRRRRRRAGEGDDEGSDDGDGTTVTRVRKPRSAEDEITTFSGSTRLEAKKQRRREGREAGRRRAPIISEAEFLARRESVDRKMVIRQRDDLTQIAVLEDKVLVEHYVARESQTSIIGNVYLGRVQNVLPSMEAAFIDIGKGRNAVLYAGEVNWDSLGAKDGNQRKIEQVLKPGQPVLVQVSKDPIGHKGARLTSQVSLPGRFLVYVPDGNTSGISRKLPENERNRLKTLLKEIVPDTAGVIVRTAAEGASEDELIRDVERLKALWEDISAKIEAGGSSTAPQLLYGEPDLTLKVVRDLFTEDIAKLVVSGADAWEMVENYVNHVAPDLADRLERHDDSERDAFAEYRIDEQINKALDRKVWLPSGGSLVIDRTEAMTVVDVNTGKFTGSGGNLEETVTKNNLEAAEEIVRQLRLRDIGGIIVIDFIDMVLESNRDLVLRRLIECLGRDRTRHQVAEVTSLGLVQMTRKRIGTGLLEAFSEPCEHCQGRGLHLHQEPVEQKRKQVEEEPRRNRRNRGRGKGEDDEGSDSGSGSGSGSAKPTTDVRRPTPAEFAAMARVEPASEERSGFDGAGRPDQAKETELSSPVDGPANQDADEQAAEVDAPSDAPPEVAREVAPAPQQETEPAAPPPPAAPRIVTSVRRVGARRPAGPPASTAATAVIEPPAAEAASADSLVEESPAVGAGAEESVDAGAPLVDGVAQPHVPVKKKGARKR
jgi:ribonuclease E